MGDPDGEISDILAKLCYRLIGKESDEWSLKARNKYFIDYQETVDRLIFLDDIQQSALEKVVSNDNSAKVKNFAFKGPPGCGKTTLAIKTCNHLIENYLDKGVSKMYVYAVVFDPKPGTENMMLLQTFKDNIMQSDNKVKLKCMTLSEMVKEWAKERKIKKRTWISYFWNYKILDDYRFPDPKKDVQDSLLYIREAVKKNTIFYDIESNSFATYPP